LALALSLLFHKTDLDNMDEEAALDALKSISHLLDDKPWQTTSQQIYSRISRTNSFAE